MSRIFVCLLFIQQSSDNFLRQESNNLERIDQDLEQQGNQVRFMYVHSTFYVCMYIVALFWGGNGSLKADLNKNK